MEVKQIIVKHWKLLLAVTLISLTINAHNLFNIENFVIGDQNTQNQIASDNATQVNINDQAVVNSVIGSNNYYSLSDATPQQILAERIVGDFGCTILNAKDKGGYVNGDYTCNIQFLKFFNTADSAIENVIIKFETGETVFLQKVEAQDSKVFGFVAINQNAGEQNLINIHGAYNKIEPLNNQICNYFDVTYDPVYNNYQLKYIDTYNC